MKRQLLLGVAACALALALAGCEREEPLTSQSVPKDPAAAKPAPQANMPGPKEMAGGVQILWKKPEGWKQLPGNEMRFATFVVSEQPRVEMSVTPLSAQSGTVAANVNRWEGQLGLQPTPEAELGKVLKQFESDGVKVSWVDLEGPQTAEGRLRMLAAIVPQGDSVWFFKMTGEHATVGKQRDNFEAFLKSIKFIQE